MADNAVVRDRFIDLCINLVQKVSEAVSQRNDIRVRQSIDHSFRLEK